MGGDGKQLLRPGAVMRYVGDRHPYLNGCRVRVLAPIERGMWDVVPWIDCENRFSWVTSDALESELEPLEDEK